MVTTTFTAPAVCARVVTVIDVAVLAVIVPAVSPKVTEVAAVKYVPVIATDCPPTAGPLVGLMFVTVGGALVIRMSRLRLGIAFVKIVAR